MKSSNIAPDVNDSVLVQTALLCVVASIFVGAGVLITEFVNKMDTVWQPLPATHSCSCFCMLLLMTDRATTLL